MLVTSVAINGMFAAQRRGSDCAAGPALCVEMATA
jgi:hypothetical protein